MIKSLRASKRLGAPDKKKEEAEGEATTANMDQKSDLSWLQEIIKDLSML